jgi:hypothetical protein
MYFSSIFVQSIRPYNVYFDVLNILTKYIHFKLQDTGSNETLDF